MTMQGDKPPAPDAWRPHFPRRHAWCVGVPLGLLIGALLLSMSAVAYPQVVIGWLRRGLGEDEWRVFVEQATFDVGEGWAAPRTWTWHVENLTILGLVPARPSFLLTDVRLTPPRPSWTPDGLVLTVKRASVGRFDIHFEEVARQEEQPPIGESWFTLVVEELEVDAFGMTMRKGLNPEVIIEATDVSLASPFVVRPARRELTGELALDVATVEIAGVLVREVHPTRLAFTGLGMEAVASGLLGDGAVEVQMVVEPLIGPPEVTVEAKLSGSTLDGLADAIMGAGDMQLIGRIASLSASMKVGGALGRGNLKGHADLHAVNVGFRKPEAHRAAVVLAVNLAPFLSFDADGNVVVGDFHGGVSFTQRGVSFDTVTYEAPHSLGELRGYVQAKGLSAKLHFTPRPGSGAIEWGFVLRGDMRKPKVALALPSVLRRWTPCEDPQNCALVGGASTVEDPAEEDAEATAAALAREARKEGAQERRDDRIEAREERQEDRQERQEDRADERAAQEAAPAGP